MRFVEGKIYDSPGDSLIYILKNVDDKYFFYIRYSSSHHVYNVVEEPMTYTELIEYCYVEAPDLEYLFNWEEICKRLRRN